MALRLALLLVLSAVVHFDLASPSSNHTHPVAAYVLDSMFRGLNLGTGGRRLKMEFLQFNFTTRTYKDKNASFDSTGPRGEADDTFVRFSYTDLGQITNLPNETFVLDTCEPFSIIAWVKMTIKKGYLLARPYPVVFLIITQSKSGAQLKLTGGKHWVKINLPNISFSTWQHIAITFNGADDYLLYVNGTAFPNLSKKHRHPDCSPYNRVYPLYVGPWFEGSVACLLLFHRNVTQQEVNNWRDTCP